MAPSPLSDAPRSAEFIRRDWPVFAEAVQARLLRAAPVYGDSSFEVPVEDLIEEIQQELLDVSGWSAIMWARLEEKKNKIVQTAVVK